MMLEEAIAKDISAAEAAGYGLFHGCVSGPQQGAMGIHYANGALVGDGAIDAQQPEALIYEDHNGQLRLVGVEYVVLAERHSGCPTEAFGMTGHKAKRPPEVTSASGGRAAR